MIAARYFSLCCAEPFRIFFPFGVLIGISGVSLWPLFFSGLHKFYPGVMHGRLMIEGFMGAFVIGFLGTAAPRLTGTATFSRTELITQLLLLAAVVGTHIAHQHFLGDLLFLMLLLFFGSRIAGRFAQRTELPPPTFALVAFGFCNAIVGTLSLLAPGMWDGFARASAFGSLLLYQGFLLYLVLGVGGFLLPRFLVLPAKPELPDMRELSKPWLRRAAFATAIGMVILASFVVEVIAEASRAAGAMRFAATLVYLFVEVPVHLSAAKPATIGRSLQLTVVFLVIGLLFPVLWPWQRVAGMHLVFIGTFTLIAFTVATRVILGHSGHLDTVARPMPLLRTTAALLLAAAAFRVAGDFSVQIRGRLLDLASYAWIIAAAIWACWIVPKVRIPDPES